MEEKRSWLNAWNRTPPKKMNGICECKVILHRIVLDKKPAEILPPKKVEEEKVSREGG